VITVGAPVAPTAGEPEIFNGAVLLRDAVRAAIMSQCGEPDIATTSLQSAAVRS
jgi:hypothetical protein